ncbi:MAG: type II 3-dehydroquinate dehydratase [Rhodospirillales bacterium]|nr:type II 3-dehydroquinate dehydratase [Alphaproteobacteria bacterium]MCB9986450.1 type II 3-dehydroquinate dehydratase [Rhodospirillales bacterium]USO07004.1 MAG: type II 3-dehydroquinate dehydratase [Rhodospirillales bacterium]
MTDTAAARTILILIGPNLNLLGTREPALYGTMTLAEIEAMCAAHAAKLGLRTALRQSNHEGELVTWIQDAIADGTAGVIVNAGAYTHTSVAIHDALKMLSCPIVEVHHSNPMAREAFRHTSYIAPLAMAVIAGIGPDGYLVALDALANKLK